MEMKRQRLRLEHVTPLNSGLLRGGWKREGRENLLQVCRLNGNPSFSSSIIHHLKSVCVGEVGGQHLVKQRLGCSNNGDGVTEETFCRESSACLFKPRRVAWKRRPSRSFCLQH